MSKDLITPIMRIQIELALANAKGDLDALHSLEIEAKHLMLSGAETDAAKHGGSFDLLTDIAVKFALSAHAGDEVANMIASRQLAAFGASEIASKLQALFMRVERMATK